MPSNEKRNSLASHLTSFALGLFLQNCRWAIDQLSALSTELEWEIEPSHSCMMFADHIAVLQSRLKFQFSALETVSEEAKSKPLADFAGAIRDSEAILNDVYRRLRDLQSSNRSVSEYAETFAVAADRLKAVEHQAQEALQEMLHTLIED